MPDYCSVNVTEDNFITMIQPYCRCLSLPALVLPSSKLVPELGNYANFVHVTTECKMVKLEGLGQSISDYTVLLHTDQLLFVMVQ